MSGATEAFHQFQTGAMMLCISMEHRACSMFIVNCAFGCVFICGFIFNYIIKHNWNPIAIILIILNCDPGVVVCIVHLSLFRSNCRYCIHRRASGIRHRTLQNINAVKLLSKLHHTSIRSYVHTCTLHIMKFSIVNQNAWLMDMRMNGPAIFHHSNSLFCAMYSYNVAFWSLHLHFIAMLSHFPHLISFWTFVSRILIWFTVENVNIKHKIFIDSYMQSHVLKIVHCFTVMCCFRD